MTTPWTVPTLWPGETVAIICPTASQELADSVAHLPRIAVKRGWKLAPDAELLVGIDGSAKAEFWQESESFAGLRVCGVECDLDVPHLQLPHDVVRLAEGHVVHIRNNLLFAMRVAVMAGAGKLMLLGVDTAEYEMLHHFRGVTEGLAALISEFGARGVEVELL